MPERDPQSREQQEQWSDFLADLGESPDTNEHVPAIGDREPDRHLYRALVGHHVRRVRR